VGWPITEGRRRELDAAEGANFGRFLLTYWNNYRIFFSESECLAPFQN
jgi:hypothetical protein